MLTLLLAYLFFIPFFFYTIVANISYWLRIRQKRKLGVNKNANEVVIVVLGDLGHSPRITYHAKSFIKLGYVVNICGYVESQVPYFLYDENVSINEIKVIKNTHRLPYIVFAANKVVQQVFELFKVLSGVIDDNTRYVLIQNPPSLPVLAVLAFLKMTICPNVKIIIDWHNLNFTILNLRFHNLKHPIVRLMKNYERILSKKYADLNFTVTEAMRDYLIKEFHLDSNKVITVYDRPSNKFEPLMDEEEFDEIIASNPAIFEDFAYNKETDKILITSTSFSADEDFSILVEALKKLDDTLGDMKGSFRILMIVTGKGPLKLDFLKEVKEFNWKRVRVTDVWLTDDEYPKILRIADLGISLHYSSSGLDLPMKIVDLFGSGVPVVSMGYHVISELVTEGKNGLLLKDNHSGQELADTIYHALYEDKHLLGTLRSGARKESERGWDDEWDEKLANLLKL
ncbi:hypothetical protein FOA43_003844 [Brettanomyces nanus]|uniref:Chitobiosyldiphosphodolichol beta-mannosyltransferase n=1 Tax=Eeniella nana TaxID=13502 RepID=A0A875S8B7_EENNA|nr:uncharacterized protein FOA43_003844 [Brettanomyces nanus]QPG76455.1 hypothetical protein FOA43_003844 [Brettanomyces nanus]